ncbi:MAG: response regulator [Lachnospiraceae bacterium]|nr:response regulator [Lachnospiraceae bacterium]
MGNDTTTEVKENKLKRRGLRLLLIVLLIVCIVSVAVIYLRYTSKSIILVPILMLCIAVLLMLLLLHPAVSGLGANKFPVPEKREKKKKRRHNADHEYAFHKPGKAKKKSSAYEGDKINIGLADKSKGEEGFSEELLKSIDKDFTGKRALLVEDNDINRDIAHLVLTKLGFEVEIAEDGKQGVDMVKTSEPGYYDVVLMDIQMPVMDGYEAARRIRKIKNKRNAQVPIVALTVCVTNEDIKASNEAGMDGHIAKPIDISKMKKVLEKALKKAYNF